MSKEYKRQIIVDKKELVSQYIKSKLEGSEKTGAIVIVHNHCPFKWFDSMEDLQTDYLIIRGYVYTDSAQVPDTHGVVNGVIYPASKIEIKGAEARFSGILLGTFSYNGIRYYLQSGDFWSR